MNCYRATLSQNILLACANEGIPVILCGTNHQPQAILWPVVSHYKQAGVLQSQLLASQPFRKQLWRLVIQSKIKGQHEVLQCSGKAQSNELTEMAKRVKSGDTDNIEAQAARRYWAKLMPEGFTRNPDLEGINSFLNYGYAIIRATVARAVISVGLQPAIGIHHQNKLNAFCLVDDLMEPYRPIIDSIVYSLQTENVKELTTEIKRKLAAVTEQLIVMPSGVTSVSNAVLLTAQSLAQSFAEKKAKLELPVTLFPA